MRVDLETAIDVFKSFPPSKRAPSLHPSYIEADAARDATVTPVFYVYNEGQAWFYHGFHLVPVSDTGFLDIQSPYGYGGPISSVDDQVFFSRAWHNYLNWCKDNNVLVEFIRFHPLICNWQYFMGNVFDDRQTVWLDLNTGDLLASYSVRARTAVRKALKNGLQVSWGKSDGCIKKFIDLYTDAMKVLEADQFYMFPDRYFYELLAWERVHLAVCTFEQEIVAAALFIVEDDFIEYHLSASSSLGKKLSATNLLLHEAALMGQTLGCKALHLGGGTDDKTDNPLFFFKAGFSDLRGSFKIGAYIHHHEAYNNLKFDWLKRYGTVSDRILFYRF